MKPEVQKTRATATKFALLELFTSEGCSSCPPADELMIRLQNEYKDQPVYLLAYHVDYWDRQGWKDVFSNHDYTIRQSGYADWFHLNSMYTPQLVINGIAEMVGSNGLKIRNGIINALSTENSVELSISSKQVDNFLTLTYQVTGAAESSQMVIAVIRKAATTKVERGENKGHVLSHIQIVQSLQKVSLNTDGKGSTTIILPGQFNKTEWELIAFVQRLNMGSISAVAKVDV